MVINFVKVKINNGSCVTSGMLGNAKTVLTILSYISGRIFTADFSFLNFMSERKKLMSKTMLWKNALLLICLKYGHAKYFT